MLLPKDMLKRVRQKVHHDFLPPISVNIRSTKEGGTTRRERQVAFPWRKRRRSRSPIRRQIGRLTVASHTARPRFARSQESVHNFIEPQVLTVGGFQTLVPRRLKRARTLGQLIFPAGPSST